MEIFSYTSATDHNNTQKMTPMKKLLIFKSPLHDQESVLSCRKALIDAIEKMGVEIVDAAEFVGAEADAGRLDLAPDDRIVCFIGTGGTEEIFREFHMALRANMAKSGASADGRTLVLLGDGYHNSFAASFEIATFLAQRGAAHSLVNIPLDCKDFGFVAELFDGAAGSDGAVAPAHDDGKLYDYLRIPAVAQKLRSSVIGLIGGQSSWLISSDVDTDSMAQKTGARFVRIPIEELIDTYRELQNGENAPQDEKMSQEFALLDGTTPKDLRDAERMYRALDMICAKYGLTALTLKCFDLLGPCGTTACYALAKLNDRGIISGCEGDIPALWTMIVASALDGSAPFMANPSSSDSAAHTVDFAHCTIPLKMVSSYRLPSHFESGIGIGIAGQIPEGEYSLFKIGGEQLDKVFSCDGRIVCNTRIRERCRTQVRFQFSSEDDYRRFLQNRTGNHIILKLREL